jgi:hypothetical protein
VEILIHDEVLPGYKAASPQGDLLGAAHATFGDDVGAVSEYQSSIWANGQLGAMANAGCTLEIDRAFILEDSVRSGSIEEAHAAEANPN